MITISENWWSRSMATRSREGPARRSRKDKVEVAGLQLGLDPAPSCVVGDVLVVGVHIDNVTIGNLDAHCPEVSCKSICPVSGSREEVQDTIPAAAYRRWRVTRRIVCHVDEIWVMLCNPVVQVLGVIPHRMSTMTIALAHLAAAFATMAPTPARQGGCGRGRSESDPVPGFAIVLTMSPLLARLANVAIIAASA